MANATTSDRILIFAEDPGAVNFIRPVIDCLRAFNAPPIVFASGIAAELFTQESTPFQAIESSTNADELLDRTAPASILVGTAENPRTFAFDLITAAKQRQVPSWGYVDSAANHDFRFRGESNSAIKYLPDLLFVIDHRSQQRFRSLGIDERRIVVCGHPNYDRVRLFAQQIEHRSKARQSELESEGQSQLNVFFLAEISTAIGAQTYQRDDDYTLTGSGRYTDRTAIVLEEFLAAIAPFRDQVNLVLRLHPKNRPTDFPELSDQFDTVQQGGCSLTAILDADLVVGMTTALIDEAALLQLPTLSITPRREEVDWCSSIAWGATPAVHDRGSLANQLAHFFETGKLKVDEPVQLPVEGAAERVAQTVLFDQPRDSLNVP